MPELEPVELLHVVAELAKQDGQVDKLCSVESGIVYDDPFWQGRRDLFVASAERVSQDNGQKQHDKDLL